jgi:transposase
MAQTTMPHRAGQVIVGVDTHGDVHVAAVVDALGAIRGTTSVAATPRGFADLMRFAGRFGPVGLVGVEGTGAYGAGLTRWLLHRGYRVVEVDRPDRKTRRAKGKSDPVDAEAAARAALSGTATGLPKARDGKVEMIRALRLVRRSAVRSRTQAMNQIHSLVITGPDGLRRWARDLPPALLVERLARLRPGRIVSPVAATKLALRELALRYRDLSAQIERLDVQLKALVHQVSPRLLALKGVGAEVAGQLLVTAGDNPGRLRSEASFAHLCGVAPLPASSGKVVRHRLNRGGDRHANEALWRIVMVRMSCDPRTKAYVARRVGEGRSKSEIMRCLKRYVAREVYSALQVDEG